MPYFDSQTAKIYYEWHPAPAEKAASVPAVTLVNGHTRSSTDFRMMVRALNAAGYSSLLIDNRGSGQTKAEGEFTNQDMQNDILEVLQHLNINQTTLLGISMGGFLCQNIALNHSVLVKGLILISTAADTRAVQSSRGGWVDDLNMIRTKLLPYFSEGFRARNPLLIETMVKQIHQQATSKAYDDNAKAQKDAWNSQTDWADRLGDIKAKTLIIHGSKDEIILCDEAVRLHQLIPHSRLEIIEEAGHLLLAEAPKVLYQIVIDFLNTV